MTQLLNIDWYRGLIQGKQMVMIGYSDSAKDAGVMAASWAQYQAQDALIKTCEKPVSSSPSSTAAAALLAVAARQPTRRCFRNRQAV
ncbi:phosphoenolpyruvate carboxylase [Salmonella enterica subsp. arizonae]|uniref:Phosphoenolpyruvate carboxylase n=1 Tax=Salmonella enterica subsp. arizonae TaxID=59203 RepID=A0A379TPK7_SALER|nr:phosphoenolpyruvate carboxylase [Salmonella enterica subsp. arizonae]